MAITNNEPQNPHPALVGMKDAIDNYCIIHRIPYNRHIPAGPTEQDADAGA